MGRITPHHGSFVKSVKTRGLEYTELGRIYGGLEAVKQKLPSPLRCMGKSAQVIDGKRVAKAPLSKRVRKYMKTQGMKEAADFAECADKSLRDG